MLRNRFQGHKRPGPLIVVLEQEPLGPDVLENRLCDELVPAARQPPAALIPTSQMKPEGHLRKALHQCIVHLDAAVEPIL